ncbi:hypothetical protein DL766_003865 [Monosporascus sp. MC13-8B]|uniref:Uncharacterized protein n=1 Tax=Monosporascus cannonballus TaxID=155416 RepID=A0ABY0HEM0_9PEZI|nr:hypothetical protein DL763_010727 [Monosporascus cannonballus]RYO90815.1 hypothetical protein DL762_002492 [Monosporascus cannonballus]RYP32645.1 hypothetical protein DL766_003865 [Monosporascus sp. MC13-8B]
MGSFALKLSSVCWAAATVLPLVSAQIPQSVEGLEAVLPAENGFLGGGLEDTAVDMMQRRQNAGTGNANSTMLAEWDSETSAACEEMLSRLNVASNPSGTAICYNLPSLDTTTGRFMADLRLYQVSTPSGAFAGIAPEDIMVGVQYSGASVSPLDQEGTNITDGARAKRQDVTPTLLQAYMLVGQINLAQMPDPMTMGGVEALVMPKVTLTARSPSGTTVNTTVSVNEAAFINGIFSKEVVMSDFGLAQLAVDSMAAQMENGTVAFVVPGVNILIFPIGLVITSIWLAIGLAAYGFGTYERYAYRDAYRTRKARELKSSSGRI